MCVAFPHSEYYGPLTSHDPFARPRFIGLLAHTAILAGITGYPTFTHESSKHAMFTDPGSAQTSRPRLEKKTASRGCPDVAFVAEKVLGHFVNFHFGAQSLRPFGLRPASPITYA